MQSNLATGHEESEQKPLAVCLLIVSKLSNKVLKMNVICLGLLNLPYNSSVFQDLIWWFSDIENMQKSWLLLLYIW